MEPIYGHESIQKKLTELIKNHKLNSSLLFLGPSHIGKKQVALFTAQTLLPQEQVHDSVLLLEPNGLSHKLETLEKIRSFLKLQSFSKRRVVIIDQAHLMNLQTQNAFLKTLEEPPANVYFILVADRSDLLLNTIHSRTTKYYFSPLSVEDLKKIDPSQSDEILRASRGQLNRIQQWKGRDDLFQEVFDFWKDILKGKPRSKSLFEKLKDRKTASLVAQTWQEILRDVRVYQEGSTEWIHIHQKELYQKMSHLPCSLIESFYQKALYLEKDIQSYLHTLICFENYFQQSRRQIRSL